MSSRRLLLVALTVVVPFFAACNSTPTGADDPNPNTPADTTGRKEIIPWH